MPQLTSQQFAALWESVKNGPVYTQADVKPIQADLSLSGLLDQYVTMATQSHNQGKISQQDYTDLTAGVNALKAILARINDKQLVADWVSQRATAITQQINAKVASVHT